jgi:hypothetical protein
MTEICVNKLFKFGLAVAMAFSLVAMARAAETVTETRQIDGRVVRVKLDGLLDVHVRQGSPATLSVRGDADWVKRTTTDQNGDTLNIETGGRSNRGHQGFFIHSSNSVRVELTLPNLRELSSESLGRTEITGFTGDELELSLEGAGAMILASNYKHVTANLGGFGSMNLSGLNSEGVELNLRGAGSVTLSGRSKWLKADLGGVGGLNAQQCPVESVNLELSGLGNAVVTAHQNANLSLSGMGSVTVYGKPLNRKVENDGLGKVSFK